MVRAFAYNPINTSGADAAFNQTLPENVREDIYRSAGMQSIYGVNLVELVELGAGKKYNTLFNDFAIGHSDGATIQGSDNLNVVLNATSWVHGTHQLLIGVDNSKGAFIRPVARQHDYQGNGTFTALPDEQFNMYGSRVEKTGFYGFLEEGRICIDARAIMGLIV